MFVGPGMLRNWRPLETVMGEILAHAERHNHRNAVYSAWLRTGGSYGDSRRPSRGTGRTRDGRPRQHDSDAGRGRGGHEPGAHGADADRGRYAGEPRGWRGFAD